MKSKILLISDLDSIEATLQAHKELIKNLLKSVNVLYLDKKLRKVKLSQIKKNFKFNKNFKVLNFENYNAFKIYLLKNNLIIWNNFGFNLKDIFIHYLIKKSKRKQIIISNLGNIQWSLKFSSENYGYSFFNYIFRWFDKFTILILIKLSVINKIDNRFQSGKKKLSHTKNLFVKNYNYINCQLYDEYNNNKKNISQDYITHIDADPNHEDDVKLRGRLSGSEIKKHYFNLNKTLENLKKIFNKKIIICIHPLYNINQTKKYFPNYRVIKYKTKYFIEKSFLVTFFDSSIIFNAIYLNKNILILKNNNLGLSLNQKINLYQKFLNIPLINIFSKNLLNKKKMLLDFKHAKQKYKNYIVNEMLSYNKEYSYKVIKKYIKENE